MKFGVLSISFGDIGHKELASKISANGFDAVHLELKHLTDVDHSLGKLSTGAANAVAEQFERNGVRIPVLGCYTNLTNIDPEQRRYGIEQLKEHLRYARDFGASAVTTETGTLNAYSPWDHHPDNQNEETWPMLRSAIEEVAEEAERWGVFLGLEGYTNNIINTPERMERLLREVPSSNIGIVMDPCNYIDVTNMHRQEEVIRDAFDRLSDRILIAHAKDFNYREEGQAVDHKEVQPAAGTGKLNYPYYLELLQQAKPNVKIYLEHLSEDQMPAASEYVRNAMIEAGKRREEGKL